MQKEKQYLWKDYIQYQETYTKKYGDNCICFIQVGSFYELYSLSNQNYIKTITELLGIVLTRKNNRSAVPDAENNPYMAGIPIFGFKKHLDVLLDNNYIVVLIDQTSEVANSKGEFSRDVRKIYSKSVGFISDDVISEGSAAKLETNSLMSVYMEEEQMLNGKSVLCVGLAVIDLAIGSNVIYEINSEVFPDIFEEIYRFMETYNPAEITIHSTGLTMAREEIIEKFRHGRERMIYFKYNEIDANLLKIAYQQNLLKKVFPKCGLLSPVEYTNLVFKNYARNAYILLLQFAYEHISTIINKIQLPQIYEIDDHLILYNNAIYQLDVVESKFRQGNRQGKFNSLFDVINHTSTSMGRRELKSRLLNPICRVAELNGRYDAIEAIWNTVGEYEERLKRILDIERYHRKMALGLLNPCEFARLVDSYHAIVEIYLARGGANDMVSMFSEYIAEYEATFDLEEMAKWGLNGIEGTVFQAGIYPDVDEIQGEITECQRYFAELEQKLSGDISKYEGKGKVVKSRGKKISPSSDGSENTTAYVKFEYHERKGRGAGSYFCTLTKRRADILKEILKGRKETDYVFETHNSEVKITSAKINEMSDKLILCMNKIRDLVRGYYLKTLEAFDAKYGACLMATAKYIADIDVSKSNAQVAQLYGYCRPEILVRSGGGGGGDKPLAFVDAREIRHPIVERLCVGSTFIANDVCLGIGETEAMRGMLLFGINSGGKSVLMKSVGLNIILAQMGGFTSATKFEYYPYKHIFTRISGDDNIFYGQSSFAVEMNELRSILRYADANSLVLGDEICRGTETISGLSIVSATIKTLAERNCSFIFATHLHHLSNMPLITELPTVHIYHLAVGEVDGRLVFERKLKRGSGGSIYGLEVAKHLIHDGKFIDMANKIRNDLLNIPEYILNPHSSKYNANVYVDNCAICGKTYKDCQLDVHHILFQSQCNEYGRVGHVMKNVATNLVTLCKEHHQAVHSGNITIRGYLETTEGIVLDFV